MENVRGSGAGRHCCKNNLLTPYQKFNHVISSVITATYNVEPGKHDQGKEDNSCL